MSTSISSSIQQALSSAIKVAPPPPPPPPKPKVTAPATGHSGLSSFESAAVKVPSAGILTLGPTANLTAHQGHVVYSPRIVNIYAGSYWTTPSGSADRGYFDRFKTSLAGDRGYANVLAQYGVGPARAGGSYTLPTANPKQVRPQDALNIVNNELHHGAKYDPNAVYTVYAPPGARIVAGYDKHGKPIYAGGYHSVMTLPDGRKVNVAVVGYGGRPGATNNDPTGSPAARDNTTTFASHEYAEAVTNPDGQGWYQPQPDGSQKEIGDVGANYFGGGTSPGDSARNGSGFAVQRLWSDQDQRLEVTARPPPTLGQLLEPVFGFIERLFA